MGCLRMLGCLFDFHSEHNFFTPTIRRTYNNEVVIQVRRRCLPERRCLRRPAAAAEAPSRSLARRATRRRSSWASCCWRCSCCRSGQCSRRTGCLWASRASASPRAGCTSARYATGAGVLLLLLLVVLLLVVLLVVVVVLMLCPSSCSRRTT